MKMLYTLGDIHLAVRKVLSEISSGRKIIAFHGEMGSGKTTFIHTLCEEINTGDVVSSPTFAVINEYSSSLGVIYHMDLYRLKDTEEAINAGIEDCLYSNAICLVEWPERAASLFPADTVHVYLEVIDEETRLLQIGDN